MTESHMIVTWFCGYKKGSFRLHNSAWN